MRRNSKPGGVWPDACDFELAGTRGCMVVTDWVKDLNGRMTFTLPVQANTYIDGAWLRHPDPRLNMEALAVHLPRPEYFERDGTYVITVNLSLSQGVDGLTHGSIQDPGLSSEERTVLSRRAARRAKRETPRATPRVDLRPKEIER